jgi:hypothetical protein
MPLIVVRNDSQVRKQIAKTSNVSAIVNSEEDIDQIIR